MAESSWPDPANGRVVDDSGWERIGGALGADIGVMGDFSSPLQMVYGDSSGRQIKIGADRHALVRGHIYWSGSSIVTKAIAANSSGSTRVDLVVLRLSRTTWAVTSEIVPGTPGAGAPAPTVSGGSTGVWEMPLATVTVANSASTITAGNVVYVAAHHDATGRGLRIPTVAAAAWIPFPLTGNEVSVADGTVLKWNGSAWEEKFGWKDWTPVVYQNMSTTRTTFGAYSINRARVNKIGKMVWATADITITGITANGMSASLPYPAASMQNSIIGSGAIINSGGAPTQDGYVVVGAGLDCVQPTTVTTGFINTTTGSNRYRFTVCYESAS